MEYMLFITYAKNGRLSILATFFQLTVWAMERMAQVDNCHNCFRKQFLVISDQFGSIYVGEPM